jgi:hypothetical protein
MLISLAVATFKTREDLVLENLALRQQIEILQRTGRRPRATKADRVFWVALSKVWSGWRDALVVFTPATVVGGHRKRFKLFWTWKSRVRHGRPRVHPEVRELIRTMNAANPLWGAPRIHGELLKLGVDISQSSRRQQRWFQASTPARTADEVWARHSRCINRKPRLTDPASLLILGVGRPLAYGRSMTLARLAESGVS